MFRSMLLAVLLGFAPALARADEPPALPPTAPPRLILASALESGSDVELRFMVIHMVPETRVRTIEKDGRTVEVTYTVLKPVYEQKAVIVDSDVEIYNAAGKIIHPQTLPKRIAQNTTVALALEKIPDATYRAALRDDVLVIVLKREQTKAFSP